MLNDNINIRRNKFTILFINFFFFTFASCDVSSLFSSIECVSSTFAITEPPCKIVDTLLMATWWQIMTKIFTKYQRNQTSIYLKPPVLGKSSFIGIRVAFWATGVGLDRHEYAYFRIHCTATSAYAFNSEAYGSRCIVLF